MPKFTYRGRDGQGRLRIGQRIAFNIDSLNADLINEGITPIEIKESKSEDSFLDRAKFFFRSKTLYTEELAIFCRQMQLLLQAGVPLTEAINQLADINKKSIFSQKLKNVATYIQKGESLSAAMQHFPTFFSPLLISLIQIGENTGNLSESFGYLFQYLEFEVNSKKQMISVFRYPTFILFAVIIAIIILNIYVIPTFSKVYSNINVDLPWQTSFLIAMSNFVMHFQIYLILAFILSSFLIYRYIRTPQGKYAWGRIQLNIPILGKLIRRLILIRFSHSLSIVLKSGVSIKEGIPLTKNTISNTYIQRQIQEMNDAIHHGIPFTQAISHIKLFAPLELQILSVGEKRGELSPALSNIADFHSQEIAFDLKRLNDLIGPILISAVALLILLIALGIYLPIWNMINLTH